MAIQNLQLFQDVRDPNKRWVQVNAVIGSGGMDSQTPISSFTLTPQQFAQFQAAGIQPQQVFNQEPFAGNGGSVQAYSPGALAPLAAEQGGNVNNPRIASSLQTIDTAPATGGMDLATDTAKQQELAAGAFGGSANPFSTGQLAMPGTTGTTEQQANLASRIANPNMTPSPTGNDISRVRDASGNLVPGTPPPAPMTPPGATPNAGAMTPTSTGQPGKEAAPFGMESLQKTSTGGWQQGAQTPPTMSPQPAQSEKLLPVTPSAPAGGGGAGVDISPFGMEGLSKNATGGWDQAGSIKAPPQPAWEKAGSAPATTQAATQAPAQQAFTPPNQDKGMARNLSAEQSFVKNWQGKEGRLPTANEINMAVYGTTNPQFNVPVKPPVQGAAVAPAPTQGGAITRNLSAEQQFVQGWQGKEGRLPTPSEVNMAVYGTPNPQFGTPQGAAAPAQQASPVGANRPPEDYLSTLQSALGASNTPSQEETDTQKRLNDLLTSRDMGINKITDQPVAMDFITGQAASVNRVAQQQADTLERQLARLQADRAVKRQAAMDVASIEERREDRAARNKPERINPIEVSSGASLVDPVTGRVIFAPTPETKPSELDKLLTPTEAARLGVPYGTTRGEASQRGTTPAFGKASSGSSAKSSSSTTTSKSTTSGQPSAGALSSMLKNYPADFKAYITSIAPKTMIPLSAASIAEQYKQFSEQKSLGVLPFGAQTKPAITNKSTASKADPVDSLIDKYLK